MIKIRQFIASIGYAIRGIKYIFKHEQNFRIQSVVAIAVTVLSFFFDLSKYEFVVVMLMIFSVLILEILNSALEHMIDVIKPRISGHVKVIKDMMAGSVLLASLLSIILGLYIFVPHIIEYLNK